MELRQMMTTAQVARLFGANPGGSQDPTGVSGPTEIPRTGTTVREARPHDPLPAGRGRRMARGRRDRLHKEHAMSRMDDGGFVRTGRAASR